VDPGSSALLTDLYQLTMLQAYLDRGMAGTAVFEFFVRKLPPRRNFLIAAGLEQALEFLAQLHFTRQEIDWLRRTGRFHAHFLDSLETLRFTGDVYAMPEGTVFFAEEPILRVVAPIREAQLVESRLINLLHFQTLIASKAARTVLAAPDRLLVDFGLRRAHAAEAGLFAARAAYLAGFSGSATVLAGMRYGVPLYGTMAHSFVQAHATEEEAFAHFARSHPHNNTLLIDTYDTEAAARKLIPLAHELAKDSIKIGAVRLDSGDLGAHARHVRRILDEGGLAQTRIFASGSLDEYQVRELTQSGAPIDGFGVGTSMDTSSDRPYLDCAYKLQEYDGRPTRKRSEGKATWPGRKQVYREYDQRSQMRGDSITTEAAAPPASAEPLLRLAMSGGAILALPSLHESREHAARQLAALPEPLRSLEDATTPYPVAISQELQALRERADALAPHAVIQ
jgi:nicotinate phosphoribosyltransferase